MAKKKTAKKKATKKSGKPDWRTLPRKDPDKIRDQRILVNLSASELESLRQAAEAADESLSTYCRRAILTRLGKHST